LGLIQAARYCFIHKSITISERSAAKKLIFLKYRSTTLFLQPENAGSFLLKMECIFLQDPFYSKYKQN